MAPTVSINLCCYNGEKYLEETLQSIFSQTYRDWELVIVNDGSSDSSEAIIQRRCSEGWPILYYYQENKGLGSARNKALELSSGSFIAFIDQDDIWMPTKLEKQIPLFRNPKIGLVFCDTVFFRGNKDLYNIYSRIKPYRGMVFNRLFENYFLSLETVVIRKDALLSLDQWFDDTLTMAEEMDLFLRIGYEWNLDYVDEPLAKWRLHPESASQRAPDLVPRENEIILEKLLSLYPNFQEDYSKEIAIYKRQIAYRWAMINWKLGNKTDVRKHLKPYLFTHMKSSAIYFLSFFPHNLIKALVPSRRFI